MKARIAAVIAGLWVCVAMVVWCALHRSRANTTLAGALATKLEPPPIQLRIHVHGLDAIDPAASFSVCAHAYDARPPSEPQPPLVPAPGGEAQLTLHGPGQFRVWLLRAEPPTVALPRFVALRDLELPVDSPATLELTHQLTAAQAAHLSH